MTVTLPARAVEGGEVEIALSGRNGGPVGAEGVRLRCDLPAGLRTADDEQVIDVKIGTLGPSQMQLFPVRLRPVPAGEYAIAATATGAGGLVALARATLRVAPGK